MDDELIAAAKDERVRNALAQKVSRERVGGEVDLMLRSPDPVGAMRLLINLNLVDTVFPLSKLMPSSDSAELFADGVKLLQIAHDHLADCKVSPPLWCRYHKTAYGVTETRLTQDEEARRLLWYAAFLKPMFDQYNLTKKQEKVPKRQQTKKAP